MQKILGFLTLTAALAASAFAQDVPRWEVYGDYSYVQFNPSVTGLQSRAFNGGGAGVQVNFAKYFGIKGDFQGYGSTKWTDTFSGPTVTPHNGTIPAGTYSSTADSFTYLFGPTLGTHGKRVNVYGEILFGGSYSNGYAELVKSIDAGGGTIKAATDQYPFTMAVGGGIDLKLNKSVSLRLGEFDYLLTRYTNPITSTNNQNSFRYLAGVVFTFGAQ